MISTCPHFLAQFIEWWEPVDQKRHSDADERIGDPFKCVGDGGDIRCFERNNQVNNHRDGYRAGCLNPNHDGHQRQGEQSGDQIVIPFTGINGDIWKNKVEH